MRRRLFGLSCTLAFLIAVYGVAWFSDRAQNGYTDPFTVRFILSALLLCAIFTLGVLFLIVVPQVLLVRWATRRFRLHRVAPFALFFLLSSAVLVAVAFLPGVNGLPLYLVGVPYLIGACSVLWWISFRQEHKTA